MKSILLHLCAFIVLGIGGVLVVYGAHIDPATDFVFEYYQRALNETQLQLDTAELIIGCVMIVLAGAAFLPRLPKRTRKTAIILNTDAGEALVQVDVIQKKLQAVMKQMPEIQKVKVGVKPTKDHQRAIIDANVTLIQDPDVATRQTINLVTQHIAESAVRVLGLEDLADIHLNVDGMKVDPKAAARSIQMARPALEEKLAAREAEGDPDTVAELAGAGLALAQSSAALEEASEVIEQLDQAPETAEAVSEAPEPETEPEIEVEIKEIEDDEVELAADDPEVPEEDSVGELTPLGASENDDPEPMVEEAAEDESTENRDEPDTLAEIESAAATEGDADSTEEEETSEGAEEADWGGASAAEDEDAEDSERGAFWSAEPQDTTHADAAEIGETSFSAVEHDGEAAEAPPQEPGDSAVDVAEMSTESSDLSLEPLADGDTSGNSSENEAEASVEEASEPEADPEPEPEQKPKKPWGFF